MEMDGKIVFFNESEAVATEESSEELEAVPRREPKKKQMKREYDPKCLPVVMVEHSMTQEELAILFWKEGFNYSFNQEKYLKAFLDDGEVPWIIMLRNSRSGDSVSGKRTGA